MGENDRGLSSDQAKETALRATLRSIWDNYL
jgi:hypothetical protein